MNHPFTSNKHLCAKYMEKKEGKKKTLVTCKKIVNIDWDIFCDFLKILNQDFKKITEKCYFNNSNTVFKTGKSSHESLKTY